MGLSFLNKKIWHPGSFANMEKTWVTEQKYREVEIRAIEKAKKIKEEKVLEEMKQIQVNKGLIPASQLNRLDFMYQCPDPEANQKTTPNEDFLLGKKFDDESSNIFMKKKLKKNIIPLFADNYANPRNEDFVRIHEDPLYLILKEEKKQRKEIEQNPYKMKMILSDIKKDFKDSGKNNLPLDEKNELYKNNKSNIIKLKENDELKRSRSLRENNSDSYEETETFRYNNYKKENMRKIKKENEQLKVHKHRKSKERYNRNYYKEIREKYENRHRDKSREKYEYKQREKSREKYENKHRDKSSGKYDFEYREKRKEKHYHGYKEESIDKKSQKYFH